MNLKASFFRAKRCYFVSPIQFYNNSICDFQNYKPETRRLSSK